MSLMKVMYLQTKDDFHTLTFQIQNPLISLKQIQLNDKFKLILYPLILIRNSTTHPTIISTMQSIQYHHLSCFWKSYFLFREEIDRQKRKIYRTHYVGKIDKLCTRLHYCLMPIYLVHFMLVNLDTNLLNYENFYVQIDFQKIVPNV